MQHTCNYYCTTDTHVQVLHSTGTWTTEGVFAHILAHAAHYAVIPIAVAPAPEAPPPVDRPGQHFIDTNGHISTTRYQPYRTAWRVTFRWLSTPEEDSPCQTQLYR